MTFPRQWDIGEFDQKGTIATRWGSRDELLHACEVARKLNIDIIIDAVLNVCQIHSVASWTLALLYIYQHKLGADRIESFPAVPVNPQNRLKDDGKVREIEGWTAFDFPGRAGKVTLSDAHGFHLLTGISTAPSDGLKSTSPVRNFFIVMFRYLLNGN